MLDGPSEGGTSDILYYLVYTKTEDSVDGAR